jgi:hypothetical protein
MQHSLSEFRTVADRTYGGWAFALAKKPADAKQLILDAAINLGGSD